MSAGTEDLARVLWDARQNQYAASTLRVVWDAAGAKQQADFRAMAAAALLWMDGEAERSAEPRAPGENRGAAADPSPESSRGAPGASTPAAGGANTAESEVPARSSPSEEQLPRGLFEDEAPPEPYTPKAPPAVPDRRLPAEEDDVGGVEEDERGEDGLSPAEAAAVAREETRKALAPDDERDADSIPF